ncbi:glycoside hydrolase family 13 protein [Granulicella sibirica]|uniref:Neopullulanase n=1 Tax=Granulicella sibirica TaxID=2479048 RepID=A0A4Q0SXY6_9BACT|nr:alpha-glucosidase [Granulicella sibirica]RXH54319.1 Neopullulanase [Granulicella sibirica]
MPKLFPEAKSSLRRTRARLTVLAGVFALSTALLSTAFAAAQTAASPASDIWWKHAVVYEIYPRSFQDSNGDGIGDLNGITQRMDYLQNLGIDAIWISPMYPSPQVDFGYDISNYEAVDPQYGTLADFDKLLATGKQHNIRVILDMVMNHTSDKHQWFVDAASSRTNPKHNWYVWNDGIPADSPGVGAFQKKYEHEGKVPPNNWTSTFGGSAWEWVPAVHQFYYHYFYIQQPDLNWRNPAVEKAMFDTMRFWLDRGVAGFRLDAIPTLFEDTQLRNAPDKGGINAQGDPNLSDEYQSNLPEVHGVIRRMRAMTQAYPGNRVLIGETYLPNTAELDLWYGGAKKDELNLPMDMLMGFTNKFDATDFRNHITEAETQLHGSLPLFVFDNHDNIRSIDRFGDGTHNPQIARLLAGMLFTSHAAVLTYYGEELGMPTTTPTRKEDVKDPIGITGWPKEKGRDGERTPMQWDDSPQAGFSTNASTWLPIPPSYKTINVKSEMADPNSELAWFHKLIELRRTLPALHDGGVTMLDKSNTNVLSWVRTLPGHPSVVSAFNFSAQPQTITLDLTGTPAKGTQVKTLLSDAPALQSTTTLKDITLPPYSTWIATVE